MQPLLFRLASGVDAADPGDAVLVRAVASLPAPGSGRGALDQGRVSALHGVPHGEEFFAEEFIEFAEQFAEGLMNKSASYKRRVFVRRGLPCGEIVLGRHSLILWINFFRDNSRTK